MGKEMGNLTNSPRQDRLCSMLTIAALVVFFFTLLTLSNRQSDTGRSKTYHASIKKLNPFQFFKQSLDVDYIQNNLEQFDQMDPRLIEYTRARYLSPPSKLPYSLEDAATTDYKDEFSAWIARFFRGKVSQLILNILTHNFN